jgi:modification methylase
MNTSSEIVISTEYHPELSVQDMPDFEALLPPEVMRFLIDEPQRSIPALAKDELALQRIEDAIARIPTTHTLLHQDCRDMDVFYDESIHLVVTSPPYWTLKKYVGAEGQLGDFEDYEGFLLELDKVWRNIYRVLVPGGRLIINVGDVLVSRRQFGRHMLFPLHASIQEHCRNLGYDNLAPIIWYKISNAATEATGNGAGFLGKPYEPGGVIKNDIEYILMLRKSGGYRSPSLATRGLSIISDQNHKKWFRQIWTDIKGASTRSHPAPFPEELAARLIRMFSFVGDVVMDPFMGTGTTAVAAAKNGRHSIGLEVEASYHTMAVHRMEKLKIRQLDLPF